MTEESSAVEEIVKLEGLENMDDRDDSSKIVDFEPSPVCYSPEPAATKTLPYIKCRSPVKGGRKVMGNIVSVLILLVSLVYLVNSFIYYSSPPEPISGGLVNTVKEVICFLIAVLLCSSRFCRCGESRACGVCTCGVLARAGRVLSQHRELISLVLGVVSSILHFYALVRWYVQEGRVYVWYSERDLPYSLRWDVKLIMSSILADFILSFVEFSLMLLTKMRPKYMDLNPHLTAFIEQEKLLLDQL